MKSEMNIESEG